MSTATDIPAVTATANGTTANGIAQPRPRKPDVVHKQLRPNGTGRGDEVLLPPISTVSSGRNTPIPCDAPPSAQATHFARRSIRAQAKHRMFPTIEYAARVSHFDPKSEYSNFRGFFVLFWIGLAIMVITSMLRHLKEQGSVISIRQWETFTENIWEMAFSDAIMVASTMLCLPMHAVFASSEGFLRWGNGGMLVQSLFQAVWISWFVNWPFLREWTWTAQVFFTLHLLAIFMKMHSWAFYNGHLSETIRRLAALDDPKNDALHHRQPAVRYPRTPTRLKEVTPPDSDKDAELKSPTTALREEHEIEQLREDLAFELTSPLGQVSYPENLTFGNYCDYLMCPTLCYEMEYPRTAGTNWMEVFFKTLAVFGCIFLMTIATEEFILPVLDESAITLAQAHSLSDRCLILAETISRLLFPFMVIFLLVFLSIFEYVLNAFAELTCFADRHFYSDWWNSVDWLEFSREWNIPVHNFLRRHVYFASASHMSKTFATLITFLVSAVAHELVMGCITKKLRGYGFFAMMLQMPIVMIQRTKWVSKRRLLNNVLFWCSMILGLSMMCALYVLV